MAKVLEAHSEYTESDIIRYGVEAVCDHFEKFGMVAFPVEVRPSAVQIERLRAELERQAKYLESIAREMF